MVSAHFPMVTAHFHCFMTPITQITSITLMTPITQMTFTIQMASISFLLISFVRKEFHIVVNCYFSSNPQYDFVPGMVLKQLNSSQLLTNSQSQGYYITSIIIIWITMHILWIIWGDPICPFFVMREYATMHALYWPKKRKSHIMLV